MDILKVLSRGTKKTAKSAQPGSGAAAKLPSAGTKTNPQLFHDEVRGMKRKRNLDDSPSESPDDLPEVDFFAPKDAPAAAPTADERRRAEAIQRAAPPAAGDAKQLGEDECRRLLRSHRLKITLLSRHEDLHKVTKAKAKAKAKGKNKKAGAGAEEEAAAAGKKDEKQQLFPQPLESFGQLREAYGISRRVAENLVFQGYRVPTEVQLGSLPLLIRPDLALPGREGFERGVDFLAVAPTGSGKTISFLIPTINHIMRRRAGEGLHGVHELEAVVIVPTRELAYQTVNVGNQLLKGTGLRILAMKKGTVLAAEQQKVDEGDESDAEADEKADQSEDEDEEGNDDEKNDDDDDDDDDEDNDDDDKRDHDTKENATKKKGSKPRPAVKVDILVTTPHLLLNFLASGPASTQRVLPTVRNLIFDEADVLLDPIFREQTMGIWTACNNTDLQLSFWSATMGSNIESLVTERLNARNESLLGTVPRPLVRLVVGLKDTAVPNIVHKLTYTASEQGKLIALRQLLRPTSGVDSGPPLRPPFLVFTQTIERASALHEELKYDIPLEAGGPSRIAALHSSLPDAARSAIMRKFRAGDIWVLITTDVLARGVDFAGVNGVVNYDVPGSAAAYVHRAGRTGRAGREGGVAVTLYTKEDIPFVKTVANVIAASEKQAGKTGEEAGVQKWLLDALPNVAKEDRKKLKERGVESRRSGGQGAQITSRSGYERRKENNRRGAIEGSKKRKTMAIRVKEDGEGDGTNGEGWGGFDD
ncbi:ATP-dependent RNA helicase ROK1 [Escovopsis weberi]|uniref:ATP-dependent RNA helicase n=1 Tax=Escovopsis weberi TaxID=150374 RepID=A0A0M9VU73_ESCWE|nr:ATP-dependent RNA helicase ROK1 [Escovopsis weberi]